MGGHQNIHENMYSKIYMKACPKIPMKHLLEERQRTMIKKNTFSSKSPMTKMIVR